ncbi:3-dehydro-L-gulonate 2-dehydrogenase [Anaerosalibacter bizertensis]|uniref:3-dehydro-L-gulonate 2-dehydrogenase n=1 Tax=Anaerosalibacter bizertensis TaxID=932217 RepID=UPI001C0F3202|nr:3-dehydro-L-gulonate 2-dehydrogenase [Anaerosalibacter bizertensis]MBU5294127.1 3-dehydro-L-gulonate 2-dehydrogenase [Anaerosalibacter bizertensis]
MRIRFDDMVKEFERILIKKGLNKEDAYESAKLFAENSLDGVYSHGVNRFPRVIEYIDKGYIDVKAKAEKVEGFGALERWDGKRGMGNLNAKNAMNRAIELSKEYGVGIVALGNTNHWMRAGSYGWQAAEAGCIGICWTNTMPNMPAWGAKDRRIGNNPFVMSIPRSNGEHVVVDTAMSQFSYGKIEEYKLKGKELPVVGGFDTKGKITKDPVEIEKTWRVLPIGFWKGSGMSVGFDLIATILSGGFSTSEIGEKFEDEYGLSQILIAIDPSKFNTTEVSDDIVNKILEDLKKSEPAERNTKIRYPGERVISVRKDNLLNGIPVVDEIWERIKNM